MSGSNTTGGSKKRTRASVEKEEKLQFYWTRTDSEPVYDHSIIVKTLHGCTKEFPAGSEEKIEDLMWMLFESEGIPPQQQRLIFAGKQLEGGYTFGDYDIRSYCTIHMVLRLRGC